MADENMVCYICNKKLKLTAIKCKCNKYFCKMHKNEKVHNCEFDYRLHNKDLLEKNMPIILPKKVNDI